MSEADRARPRMGAAAQQPGIRDGMVGRAKGPFGDQGLLFFQHTDDTEWDNEDLVALKDAWSGLKESCQELLRLHFYQGLKLAEIADILGRNAGAVRKQKERCRNELIQLFTNQSKH